MERKETKKKILDNALILFSEQGYKAVSVEMIATAVGIKAPSLYKHYKSKQDIFDAIIQEMNGRYQAQAASLQLNGMNPDADKSFYLHMSVDYLIELGRNLFLFFLHDDYTSRFRKLMILEQYRDIAMAEWFTKQYIDDPVAYQAGLFTLLSTEGNLKEEEAQIMALHFYSPIYLLLILCDAEPQREEEALKLVEKHIRQFCRIYQKG